MDEPKIEKLFRLIELLIGNRRTTRELADILGCNVRTIQRYINHIRNARFVVESNQKGVYFISTNDGLMKDLSELVHFSKEEAFLLRKAIDSIDDNTTIKNNLKQKLYNIYHYVELADVVIRPQQGKIVQNLIKAIEQKLSVELVNYRSSNSNTVATRFVEPFAFTTNYQQVCCYEPASGISKLFKISRIEKVIVYEDKPWTHEEKHIKPHIDIFRIADERYVAQAKLKLNLRAYNLLIEEYPLAEQFSTQQSENEYLLDAPVCSFDGVGRFILGLFEDIQILGDENLIRFINQKISNLKSITTAFDVDGK
ncbi:MAG TPA: WYL domain-containing protein [Salinivirgaceae bacterium]|nr:WYL domain-containing protein [Salinivirgaceae bacterium]